MWSNEVWQRSYSFLILAITYLLPLSVLSITYGLVIGKLWRRRAPGNADSARDSQQLKSKRRVSVIVVSQNADKFVYCISFR